MGQAGVIVIGNENGGAVKFSISIHLTVAPLHAGARVAVLDLDLHQQSLGHFFASRRAWLSANQAAASMPIEHALSADGAALAKASEGALLTRFQAAFEEVSGATDFVVTGTPSSDTAISWTVHGLADLIVTPMSDSFVDFDMLGVMDPVTLELTRHSLYSETVSASRKARATREDKQINWVVLRDRMAPTEARNHRRLDARVEAFSRKVGFRIGPGLRDSVIYRELSPSA